MTLIVLRPVPLVIAWQVCEFVVRLRVSRRKRGTISPPIRWGKREAARRDFTKRTESGWVAETGVAYVGLVL